MAVQMVAHIADVSLKDHFAAAKGARPANGQIKVSHNTFDVTFADGRVSARFTSGNWFTNMFRSSTLARLTRTLQGQYDAWIAQDANRANAPHVQPPQAQAPQVQPPQAEPPQVEPPQVQPGEPQAAENAQAAGFKDNPNVPKALAAVEECRAILQNGKVPGADVLAKRLDDVRKLAEVRNRITNEWPGSRCDGFVRGEGFLTHTMANCEGKSEAEIKRYVVNMLDTVVDGFLQALAGMKDKAVEVPDFLRKFDGVCVEAKGDNIQEWLSRAGGIAKAARSDSSHDLAMSVTLEFNAIADEVKKPFADAARAACEAEIRAKCKDENIDDEEAIERRIESKVQMELFAKDKEIAPLIRQKLEGEGRFAVYEALVGAKRPLTEIAKGPNENLWTVTTVKDANDKPVMKNVSALDIDSQYDMLVEMYMKDAISMGLVENKTRVDSEITFATREDLRAGQVVSLARKVETGNVKADELKALVKAELAGHAATIQDDQFDRLFAKGLSIVLSTRKKSASESAASFRLCVNAHGSAAYLDKTSDMDRLAHLVAHAIAVNNLSVLKDELLSDLDAKASRFAYLLANAHPDRGVDVAAAKQNFKKLVERLAEMAFPDKVTPENEAVARKGRHVLSGIQYAGTFFFDRCDYDLGHRAAGRNEIKLHKMLNRVVVMAEKLLKDDCLPFMGNAGAEDTKEVQ